MSLLNFTLEKEHIALLKAMNWSLYSDKFVVSGEDLTTDTSPFGGNDIYEDMDLIIYGKPEGFDPNENKITSEISQEKKEKFDKLLSELPLALEVILRTQGFELGDYRAKFHQRFSWKKKQS